MNYIKTLFSDKTSLHLTAQQQKVAQTYPFRVSSHYSGLVMEENDPLWRQCMPDSRELDDFQQEADPLAETSLSPVPGLIHRYPDRVVLLVSNCCAMYCRFCMRKRMVGCGDAPISPDQFDKAVAYIRSHPAIHDVVLSGGDPLMLDDDSLNTILSRLRTIPSLSIIRIGTRIPVTLPERVTPELCRILRKFQPLYINTHFNHPAEITPQSSAACALLADAGIPLGNQSVLLKGVNDELATMRDLLAGLLAIRVKPYYLHQMDLVRGTAHFRTSVSSGLELLRGLRGHVSGMAIPHYMIDLPGGKGKVALLPHDVERVGDVLHIRTYTGERVTYRDVP